MIRKLLSKVIHQQERALGSSLDWLREVAQHSLPAFFKIALLTPAGSHRRKLPKEAWHVARLVATLHEDCGPCAQITVNLAQKDGVQAEVLQAVLRRNPAELSDDLQDVYSFVQAICEHHDDPDLRDTLRARYGDEAIVDLALAIAMARVIPTAKRALGHARSCSLVTVHA